MPRDATQRVDSFALDHGPWLIHESALPRLRSMARSEAIRASWLDDEFGPPPLRYQVTPEGVGVLRLQGMMMRGRSWWQDSVSTDEATAQVRAMGADEKVGAVLLHITSPGGYASSVKVLADAITALDEVKPVHAFIDGMGASAAYWVACQARSVAAADMALVGSLGTFTVLYDFSKAAEEAGIKVHVISTGPHKGDAPGAPVTDEDLEEARSLVEAMDAYFRKAVRDGREKLSAKDLDALWTGRVWMAKELRSGEDDAKSLGLVDRIETYEEVLERLTAPLRQKALKAKLAR